MHSPYTIKSFLVEHLKPFRLWISLMLGVMTLWALDLSIRPYILKIIVDKLFTLDPKDIEQGVLLPAVLYGGLTFLLVLAFRVFDYSWLKLNAPLKRAIGDSLSTHLMYHSQSFYKDHFAGSL